MKGIMSVVAMGMTVASLAAAQDTKPTTDLAKRVADQVAAKRVLETVPAKPSRFEPGANARIDLTITDSRSGTTLTKTMTMTVADTMSGRVRTQGDILTQMGTRPVILNVDATPRLQRDGKIQLMMSIDYRPLLSDADTSKSAPPNLSESISVLLEDGKSVVVSQSADPSSDRQIKVEVKATILR